MTLNLNKYESYIDLINRADYDELTTYAQMVDQGREKGQWILGDIMVEISVKRHWSLKEFASDIQMNYNTVRKYYEMSDFYSPDTRAKLKAKYPAINRSILEVAKRNNTLDEAIDFIETCARDGISWTVQEFKFRKAQLSGDKPKPKRIGKCEAEVFGTDWYSDGIELHIEDQEIADKLDLDKTYIIEIWEKRE